MSYRTILVRVDESRHVEARIEIAANIAVTENAHLIGAAMTGVSRFLYETVALNPADSAKRYRQCAVIACHQPGFRLAGDGRLWPLALSGNTAGRRHTHRPGIHDDSGLDVPLKN